MKFSEVKTNDTISKDGFSNWKKQYTAIPDHEASQAHMNAKLSQVMFLQQRSLNDILKEQNEEQERRD